MKKVLIVSLMGFSIIAQGNYCSQYIPVQPHGNAFVVPQKNPALTVLEQQARDKIKAIQNESSDSVRMTLQEELRSIQSDITEIKDNERKETRLKLSSTGLDLNQSLKNWLSKLSSLGEGDFGSIGTQGLIKQIKGNVSYESINKIIAKEQDVLYQKASAELKRRMILAGFDPNDDVLLIRFSKKYNCSNKTDNSTLLRSGDFVGTAINNSQFYACFGDCTEPSNWMIETDSVSSGNTSVVYDCNGEDCTLSGVTYTQIPTNDGNLTSAGNLALTESRFGRAFSFSNSTHTVYNTVRENQKKVLANPNLCSRVAMSGDSTGMVSCDTVESDSQGNPLFNSSGNVVFSSNSVSLFDVDEDNGLLCREESVCTSTELRYVEEVSECSAENPITTTLTEVNSAKGFCGLTFPKDDYTCVSTKAVETRRCDLEREVKRVVSQATIRWSEKEFVSCGQGTIDGSLWIPRSVWNRPSSQEHITKVLTAQTCPKGRTGGLGGAKRGSNYLYVQTIPDEDDYNDKKIRFRMTGAKVGGKHAWWDNPLPTIDLIIDLNSSVTGVIGDVPTQARNLTPNQKTVTVGRGLATKVHIANMNWTGTYSKSHGYGKKTEGRRWFDYKLYYTGSCTQPHNKVDEQENTTYYHAEHSRCSVQIEVDRYESKPFSTNCGWKITNADKGQKGYVCDTVYRSVVANSAHYSTGEFALPHPIIKLSYSIEKDATMVEAEQLRGN